MAFKIRDEGDVLESNLRFHHALGVDHFVVTDNGSTDATVDILGRYAEAGLATVIEAPNTDYREQGARWMTEMARLAATDLCAAGEEADPYASGELRLPVHEPQLPRTA